MAIAAGGIALAAFAAAPPAAAERDEATSPTEAATPDAKAIGRGLVTGELASGANVRLSVDITTRTAEGEPRVVFRGPATTESGGSLGEFIFPISRSQAAASLAAWEISAADAREGAIALRDGDTPQLRVITTTTTPGWTTVTLKDPETDRSLELIAPDDGAGVVRTLQVPELAQALLVIDDIWINGYPPEGRSSRGRGITPSECQRLAHETCHKDCDGDDEVDSDEYCVAKIDFATCAVTCQTRAECCQDDTGTGG